MSFFGGQVNSCLGSLLKSVCLPREIPQGLMQAGNIFYLKLSIRL